MYHKTFSVSIALLISLLIGSALWKTIPAEGKPSALLTFEPQQIVLRPGEQGQISVWVRGIEDLYGAEMNVHYNPAILEIVDSDSNQEGVQITLAHVFRDGFIAVNKVDQEKGMITFAATLVNPAPPFQGDGELVQMAVKAKALGETDLTFEGTILANRNGMKIDFEAQSAILKVSETKSESASVTDGLQPKEKQEEERRSNEEGVQPFVLVATGGGLLLFVAAVFYLLRALRRREG